MPREPFCTSLRLVTLLWLIAIPAACAGRARGVAADTTPQTTLPVSLPTTAPHVTGDSSCTAAFDSLRAIFRRDYPGYRDKAAGREAELAALTESVRAVVGTSEHHSVCVGQGLQRWVRFFRDPHVMVWQAGPPAPRAQAVGSPPAAAAGQRTAEDPNRPTLRFVDDSTAVLQLPDFDAGYKPVVDSLIAAQRARLLVTPYLVIDVRGNGGGCTCTFASVLPLLYTGPISVPGADVWSTEANAAFLAGWLTDSAMPPSIRTRVREVLPRMRASPNQFVVWAADTVLRLDTALRRPRQVAVLIDRKCASSCEDFVLAARQSHKVTLLGAENTAGTLDYGNVRSVWLPGWRRLRVPTSRSRRLPKEPLDMVGVAPHVRIQPGEADPLTVAQRYLRDADKKR